MTILLFGVSNVGKSVTGELLAERLGYDFYVLDEEVKNHLNITLEEFISMGTLYERDQIRGDLINSLIVNNENKVIAITPLSYMQDIILRKRRHRLCIFVRSSVRKAFTLQFRKAIMTAPASKAELVPLRAWDIWMP